MKEGLDTLRILFYANLLRGQRDPLKIIEVERENDKKMEIELVRRRQQRNNEAGDTEEPGRIEPQQPSSNAGTPDVSASPTTAPHDRSRNSTTNTSSNEEDVIRSIYQNALQLKLDIKPNEYRHGQYPFDDFVNEYANENIQIRKEYLEFIQRQTSTIQFSFIFYPFFLSTINKTGNSKDMCSFF